MQIHNRIATDLSSILSKKFDKLTIANEQAMSTIEPDLGRIFTLEYTSSGKAYGSVTVNIVDPEALVVYYNNNITEDMNYEDKSEWYGFLKELRYFAKRNLMGFDVRNIGKQQLDKQDYAYIKVNDKSETPDEIAESKLHGSIKTSYQQIGEVRLIIKHTKPVDEARRGARTRQVHSMYIEDAQKQRTKIPFNFLAGARAFAQHINQGGAFDDEFGQHIHETIQEVVDLKKFVKAFRRVENFAEQDEAVKIIEQARERAQGLVATLKTLGGPKGYKGYVEQYEPTESFINQADYDEIRGKLIRIQKDNIVDSVLPSLAQGIKAMENDKAADDYDQLEKDSDMKNATSIADVIAFAKSNDPIELIDQPEQVAKLKSEIDVIKSKKFSDDEQENVQQKNRNIVATILDYLEFNVADDAMGTTLTKLDYDNKQHSAAAYQLALKYLKGNTKKITKAKKDLYGKDKMEDQQFEDWANNISEGTWAIPDTAEAVEQLAKIMENPLPVGADGENATGTIGGFLGDDELFDNLGDAGDQDPETDARPIIQKWVAENIERYNIDPALIDQIKNAMQYNESVNEAKATWPKSDDDESAPDVGDTVMHDKHGLVKVLKITDRDSMMEPAEYIVQTKRGKKTISFDQLVMGESINESPEGDALQMAYDKVYDFVGEYDDAALEYLDDNAPTFSEMADKYDYEFDVMAKELDADTLKVVMDELHDVAVDFENGVLESKFEDVDENMYKDAEDKFAKHKQKVKDKKELEMMKKIAGLMGDQNKKKTNEDTIVPQGQDAKVDLHGDSMWDKEGDNPPMVYVKSVRIENPYEPGGYMDDEEDDGYRQVYVTHDGPWTVYTDSGFSQGISSIVGFDVDFSEQGMQDDGEAHLEGTKPLDEGVTVMAPIDRDRYQERDGLEGPMQTKAGKVVYYDAKEGKYYDPDTDMYLSNEEWDALNETKLDEACGLKCKHCGDMLGEPTTDCEYDSMDPKGDNWIMVDLDGDGDSDIAVKDENHTVEAKCEEGHYWCRESQMCKPIPDGYHVMPDGELMSDDEPHNEDFFKEEINRILGLAGLK